MPPSSTLTLKVEGLGKLAHAHITPKPLMLLVGENNSGKSYLASLLWGFFGDRSKLVPVGSDPDFFHDAIAWVQSRLRQKSAVVEKDFIHFDKEGADIFERLLRDSLRVRGTEFVRYILNNNSIECTSLDVQGFRLNQWPISISVSQGKRPLTEVPVPVLELMAQVTTLASFCARWFERSPTVIMFPHAFDGHHRPHDPIYLPASRTGFMLLYRSVASNLMNRSLLPGVTEEISPIELTLPMIQFLNILATDLGDELGPYAEEADFLERELQGKVEKRPGVGFNYFHFRADGAPKPLPMNLASSLVTELSPIILVLRHKKNFPVLILEEPEAHLHPKLQRKLAQVIVRLIRKGLWVWVTTHSENFCQQINNFIKIGSISNRIEIQEKLGYAPQDYLNLDEVAGYQFELDEAGEKATASEIPISEQGFAMRSFNRELRKLSRETAALQEAVNQR